MKAFVYLGHQYPPNTLVVLGTGATARGAERDARRTSFGMGQEETAPNSHALDVAECCAALVSRWDKVSPGKADGDFTMHAAGCPQAMP